MKKIRSSYFFHIVVLVVAFMQGCMSSPYYQKDYAVPGNAWDNSFKPAFEIEIKDTTALYNLYFIIRHTDAYPFSNIWMWIYTKKPGEKTFEKTRIEVPLAESSGKWLGRGMGELYEQRMPITRNDNPMTFPKPGIYTIRLEQNMRTNPLPEVLNVGLRIENTGHTKTRKTAN